MKISEQRPVVVIDFYHGRTSTVADVPKERTGGQRPDVIEISPQAREISALKKAVEEIAPVRMDKVALMKQQMERGRYKVDADMIAAKLIESYSRS